MDITASLADSTLSDPIPRIEIEQVEQWRCQLNFVFPESAMAAYSASQLTALNFDWSKLGRVSNGRHGQRLSLRKRATSDLKGLGRRRK